MPYTPDPTDATQPTAAGVKASTAAAEFTALKGYIQATILPLIAAKLPLAGGVVSALVKSTAGEAFRLKHDTGYLSGYNALETIRTGYLQFVAASGVALVAEIGTLSLWAGSVAITYDGSNVFGPNNAINLGKSTNRWANFYGVAANFSGTVAAAAFTGDGSGLTGVSGGGSVTGAQVIAALGYTPYNATNPSSYITGINSGMVTTALGFTPYNATNPNAYISGISGAMVNAALGLTPGTNATGARTVSSSAPSGGVDGDIWYQV